MPDFSSQFTGYLIPEPETVAAAIKSGMVVLDTNVLLGAYRFAPRAREELLSALERLDDRLWIPHQVALEFHRNRYTVIADHDQAYKTVLESLATYRKSITSEVGEKIRQLSNRTALPDKERDRLIRMAEECLLPLEKKVESLRKDHGLRELTTPDPVLARLQRLFKDRVGAPFEGEALSDASAEAARRVKESVPPGYKDSGKGDASGDYFVWAQSLDEAARRRPPYLTLITGDIKEDWYLRVKGQTITARPELTDECFIRSGARLLLMSTRSFLGYAREYLHATVSSETIQQAESVDLKIDGPSQKVRQQQLQLGRVIVESHFNDDKIRVLKNRVTTNLERKFQLQSKMIECLRSGLTSDAQQIEKELVNIQAAIDDLSASIAEREERARELEMLRTQHQQRFLYRRRHEENLPDPNDDPSEGPDPDLQA